jgi:hypothetical protein
MELFTTTPNTFLRAWSNIEDEDDNEREGAGGRGEK